MEIENKYASKGVAGAGLGLGIAGTALGLLGGNSLNGILGGWGMNGNCNSDCMPVTRYDAGQSAKIAELETQIALRDANIFTDGKLNDLRNYVDGKFAVVNDKLCEQAVYNATNTATIGCIANQVAALNGLTKLVIPNTSVCPGWGNVTVTPATAPTT